MGEERRCTGCAGGGRAPAREGERRRAGQARRKHQVIMDFARLRGADAAGDMGQKAEHFLQIAGMQLTTPLALRSSMMCGRLSCMRWHGWVLRRRGWMGLVNQPSARSAWRYTTPASRKRLGEGGGEGRGRGRTEGMPEQGGEAMGDAVQNHLS